MKIFALVVDDEAPARDELVFMLNNTGKVSVIAEASNGKEALKMIEEKKPDVVFLDIQMPYMSGLEVAEKLLKTDNLPQIVFVTAYNQYAIKAFDLNAVDYLLKPISEERLNISIERLVKESEREYIDEKLSKVINQLLPKPKKIPVHSKKGRIRLIDPSVIILAFTNEGRVFVKTDEGDFETSYTLRELEEMIQDPNFFRCHRCNLVNINRIKEIIPWFKGNYRLVLETEDEMEIPVGRTKIEELKRFLHL